MKKILAVMLIGVLMLGVLLPNENLQANENKDDITIDFIIQDEINAVPGQLFDVTIRHSVEPNSTIVLDATIFVEQDGSMRFYSVEYPTLQSNRIGIHLRAPNIYRNISSDGKRVTVNLADAKIYNYGTEIGTYTGGTSFTFQAKYYPR